MTVGEKIKIARSLRGITQKELGFLVGLPDVRIRQYETDARTPKADKLAEIAKALGVSHAFFINHNIDDVTSIMHLLFELELTSGLNIEEVEIDKKKAYRISFSDSSINARLEQWYIQNEERKSNKGEDVEKNYMLWKAQFPESMTKKQIPQK